MAAAPLPPVAAAPAQEAAPLSQGARIINTFIAPSKTFTDLRRSAAWWAPWILISVFALLFGFAVQRQVTFDQITKNEIARSPKASEQFERLTPEQKAQQTRISNAIIGAAFFGSPVVILLIDLIVCAVLFGTFKLATGGDLKFKTAFAVVIYSGLPGIIQAILGTISMFAGIDPEGFNVNNPVGTNPAYYMDQASSKFLLGLASIPDIINIWSILLLGIGFSCAGKIKRSTAFTIVIVWYLVWKLGGAALAGARG